MKKLGNRLKELRNYFGYSQRKMADMVGVTPGHWSSLESGARNPSESLVRLLVSYFEINDKWLRSGKGEMFAEKFKPFPDPEVIAENENKQIIEKKTTEYKRPKERSNTQLKALISEAVNEAMGADNTHKLIIAYLEELLDILREKRPETRELALTAEYESTELKLDIPEPPKDLSGEKLRRWRHNMKVLQRWQKTEKAFWVPVWAMENFCREVVHFYEGGRGKDVGGVLKDIVEKGKSR